MWLVKWVGSRPKKITQVEINSNLPSFTSTATMLLKSLKKSKTLKDVPNDYILNNSWKKLPDFRANTLPEGFRTEDFWK